METGKVGGEGKLQRDMVSSKYLDGEDSGGKCPDLILPSPADVFH